MKHTNHRATPHIHKGWMYRGIIDLFVSIIDTEGIFLLVSFLGTKLLNRLLKKMF